MLGGNGVDVPYSVNALHLGRSLASSLLGMNLPGIKCTGVKTLDSIQQLFDTELSMTTDMGDLNLDDDNITTSSDSFVMKQSADYRKQTVDDFGENELEFYQQLKLCTAQMESTLLEDVAVSTAITFVDSTVVEESVATFSGNSVCNGNTAVEQASHIECPHEAIDDRIGVSVKVAEEEDDVVAGTNGQELGGEVAKCDEASFHDFRCVLVAYLVCSGSVYIYLCCFYFMDCYSDVLVEYSV